MRSLHDVGPILIQSGMTVLTGENDGGKTATLDAIAFLLGSYSPEEGDRTRWAVANEPIAVTGTFFALDDVALTNPVRVRTRWQPGGTVDREILDKIHPGMGGRPEDLSLNELRGKLQTLGASAPGGSAKQPYVEAARRWLSGRPAAEFEDCWRPLSRAEGERLPALTRFSSVAVPSPIAVIQTTMSREARRLLKENRYADRLTELGKQLDAEIAPSLAEIRAKIEEYCQDLDEVRITATFDFGSPTPRIDVYLRRQGQDFDLNKGGEGRRRRVALAIHEASLKALAAETPTATEIIVYDEPDTHLDYASQRALFAILERQAALRHVQVIVATHSLNFIDRVPLRAVVHFRLDGDLRTNTEVLAGAGYEEEMEFLGSVGLGLGLRNSVLLDERCFLVVEGPTEEAALPALFQVTVGASLMTRGVAMLNTRGSGGVRRLVEVLRGEWKRNVVVLADMDQRDDVLAWTGRMGLGEGDRVYLIGGKEFEDAFADETWLEVLRRHFPVCDGGVEWTLEEIQALRAGEEEFAEALRTSVRRRCRDARIGKPDLGAALGRTISDVADVPVVLQECLREAARAGVGA